MRTVHQDGRGSFVAQDSHYRSRADSKPVTTAPSDDSVACMVGHWPTLLPHIEESVTSIQAAKLQAMREGRR